MRIEDTVFVFHLEDEGLIHWHGRLHSHPERNYEIHYFISGEGSFLNGTNRYRIGPGDIFLTPPGIEHRIIPSDRKSPITYYAFLFDTEGDADLETILATAQRSPRKLGLTHRFFFADTLQKRISGSPRLRTAARYQFLAFLYSLEESAPSGASGQDNVHVEKALAIMHGSIEKGCTLSILSSKTGIGGEHLVRLFGERMGMTPMRYFLGLRMEAARAMLSGTELPVGHIAERLRYGNQFNFSRAFKKFTGLSPSEYRARGLQKAELVLR